MANFWFLNSVDNNLNTVGNWFEDDLTTAKGSIPTGSDSGFAVDQIIDSGTVASTMQMDGVGIEGGTFQDECYISNNSFNGYNIGGTFNSTVSFAENCLITGGVFNGDCVLATTGSPPAIFATSAAVLAFNGRLSLDGGSNYLAPYQAPGSITIEVA